VITESIDFSKDTEANDGGRSGSIEDGRLWRRMAIEYEDEDEGDN
jgi:hypothetical protein